MSAVPATNWKTDFYDRLAAQNLAPLWERMKGLVPAEPAPKAVPWAWSFEAVKPYLTESGSLISAEEAERRVLVLENPGLPGQSQITDTLYSGLQTLLPGEVAPAHRHTQSALRFVLSGERAFTTVDGERTIMKPGDFIITPAWTWHDHGHSGDEPVVWLDGLDVPLVQFLRAGFREETEAAAQSLAKPDGYSTARYGSGLLPIDMKATRTSPVFNYPYDRTRDALEQVKRHSEIDPHFGICLRYINPTTGDWAMPTIATTMRLIPKDFETKPYRSTEGSVFVLAEGEMDAIVGNQIFKLMPHDVLVVPGWVRYRLKSVAESVVFSFSDRPVYEKLGLWREERTEIG